MPSSIYDIGSVAHPRPRRPPQWHPLQPYDIATVRRSMRPRYSGVSRTLLPFSCSADAYDAHPMTAIACVSRYIDALQLRRLGASRANGRLHLRPVQL